MSTTARCLHRLVASAASRSFPVRTVSRSFAASMEALKELRAMSGAPIVECKKALEATSTVSDAMDWLRKHGAAKASAKVQGRETTEGLVGLRIAEDQKSAALIQVACETDFAGRSQKFVELVEGIAAAALKNDAADGNHVEVKALIDEAIVAIRENLSLAEAVVWKASDSDDSILIGYVHNKVDMANAGTAAALVEIAATKGQATKTTMDQVGKKLAMHIVAARPLYCRPEDVPPELVEKERDILTAQVQGEPASAGKPLEIVNKIVEGRLRKFYESVCLTEQPHMIEDKNPKVSKVLKDSGIDVLRFKGFSVAP